MKELTPYDKLATAIILQACNDYLIALSENDTGRMTEIERFFKSDWYYSLIRLDGEFLIRELRKEYKNGNNKTISRFYNSHKW